MSSYNAPFNSAILRPSSFLTLAPVQSASYPKHPSSSPPPTTITGLLPEPTPLALTTCHHCGSKVAPPSPELKPVNTETRSKRSNSNASEILLPGKNRFLKLGPVFWGGNAGDVDYALED